MSKAQADNSTTAIRTTYDKILNAAAQCMLQEGYRETRMTTIADRCGISRAALYKYFPTKDSILLELNQKVLEEAVEHANKLSISHEPALVVIHDWMTKYLSFDQAGFVRAVMIDDAQQVLALDQEATSEALKNVKKALIKVLRRGIKEGDIRADIKPSDMAQTLQALVFSVKRNYLASRPVIDLSDRKHRSILVDTIIAGLKAR